MGPTDVKIAVDRVGVCGSDVHYFTHGRIGPYVVDPVPFDVAGAQAKVARIETVFRYADVYPRAIALIAAGKVDLEPLISATFAFDDGIAAFRRAAEGRGSDVKVQIKVSEGAHD